MNKKILVIIILALMIIAVVVGYLILKPNSDIGNAGHITEQDLSCGSYWGQFNDKKPGTPDNWVWVDDKKDAYWHAPNINRNPAGCFSNNDVSANGA